MSDIILYSYCDVANYSAWMYEDLTIIMFNKQSGELMSHKPPAEIFILSNIIQL